MQRVTWGMWGPKLCTAPPVEVDLCRQPFSTLRHCRKCVDEFRQGLPELTAEENARVVVCPLIGTERCTLPETAPLPRDANCKEALKEEPADRIENDRWRMVAVPPALPDLATKPRTASPCLQSLPQALAALEAKVRLHTRACTRNHLNVHIMAKSSKSVLFACGKVFHTGDSMPPFPGPAFQTVVHANAGALVSEGRIRTKFPSWICCAKCPDQLMTCTC